MPRGNGAHRHERIDELIFPVDLRLSGDCRYLGAAKGDDLPYEEWSRCCRREIRARRDQEPLCLSLDREDETYRFFWESSFDGWAVVCIGWRGEATVLRASYAPGLFNETEKWERDLTADQRKTLLDALAAVEFWTRGTIKLWMGTDGATGVIEGRRGNLYRRWSMWGPEIEMGELVRMFFDLSGPPLSNAPR